jgi:hypothetical protein
METDFFATHKAQCEFYLGKLAAVPGSEQLALEMTKSIAKCEEYLLSGSKRENIKDVFLTEVLTKYEAMPQASRDKFMTETKPPPAVVEGEGK